MDDRIVQFIDALRAAGVRISVAESADALRAIEVTGIADKDVFRAAMQATLVKEAHDIPEFERLFPSYFGSGPPPMPNQPGGGRHVCNCGYVTAAKASGRGVARQMCLHSLGYAKTRDYRAMQFNFVVSTNERAVRLWQALGFKTVGRLPLAFNHPREGYVDAFVMFRSL